MKTTNPTFTNRTLASILLALSAVVPLTVSTDAKSAVLSITSIIHETFQPSSDPNCGSPLTGHFDGNITGTGVSSLLGRVSISGKDCVTAFPDGHFSFAGEITLSTANGFIFADYEGLFVPTSYPSIFLFTDSSFTITGGTGSFKKAEGSGIFLGGENIATGNGLLQVIGTITGYKKLNSSGFRLSSLTTALDGSFDTAAMTSLDPVPLSSGMTLGQYLIGQNPEVLADTPLPQPASLALLGIGLASLALVRRRKPLTRTAI